MELTTMIGQRICTGFTGTEVTDEIRDLVKKHKVGNILLFSRNVVNFDQLRTLCKDLSDLILSETGLPPFIMIDEECGAVSRIGHLAGDTPCAGAMGSTGDPENARTVGRIIGKRLRAAGINLNLAPVLDCLSQPRSTVMGNRCFSESPDEVARFGKSYIEGIRESGILSCGKHFPGHGDTAVDSHFALPVVDKSLPALEQTELVSFREAIRTGLESIMTAHIVFPALDPDLPATISPRIQQGLLRQRLGFEGLVISDGMEMQAMQNLFPVPEGVFRALQAGIDIVLVCHEPNQAAAACERVLAAVEQGKMAPEDLEEHFSRIQRFKQALPSPGSKEEFSDPLDRKLSSEIMDRAVRVLHAPNGSPLPEVNQDTLFWARSSRRASPAMDSSTLNAAAYAAARIGSTLVFTGTEPLPESRPATAVFFLEKGDHLQDDLAEASRLASLGTQTILVGLDTAFVLESAPPNTWHIAAWQYQTLALDAVLRMLKQRGAEQ